MPVYYRRLSASAVDGRGAGAPRPRVVLLHGGFSDTRVFEPMAQELAAAGGGHSASAAPGRPAAAAAFDLWAYDRRGHGRTPDSAEPLSFESKLRELVAMLEGPLGGPAHLVGHSDGASLALLAAHRRPDLVLSVSAFSGNLDPSGMVPGDLLPEDLARYCKADYDAIAPDPSHLDEFARKIVTLWYSEPRMAPSDVAAITCPVLIAAGEDDSIQHAHTLAIAEAIPGARLHIVAGAGHMQVETHARECAALVADLILGRR